MIEEEITELSGEWIEEPRRTRWHPKKRGHTFVCPSATLVCDSVSKSKSKCGYSTFTTTTPPKIYLHQSIYCYYRYHVEHPVCGEGHAPIVEEGNWDAHASCDIDPVTCVETTTPDTELWVRTTTACDGSTSTRSDSLIAACGDVSQACGGTLGGDSSPPTSSITATDYVVTRHYGTLPDIHNRTHEKHLTTEYTTNDLKANTISALPAYCGVYGCSGRSGCHTGTGCSCSATANLSSDETSYTLQRVQYKILLSVPACAGMIVSWNYHFQPSPFGSPTNTAGPGFMASGGETEIGPFVIPDPTSNGTTTITDITVNCSDCSDGGTQVS